MRLFFALELSDEIRQRVISVQGGLKEQLEYPNYRWTDPSGLHVTLCFLGDVPESDIDTLQEQAESIARKHCPCRLKLDGLGAFPKASRPRVLWIGIQPAETLEPSRCSAAALAADLGGLCQNFGNASPAGDPKLHVTMARSKLNPSRSDGARLKKAIETFPQDLGELEVTEFVLFSSSLGKDAPSYKPLIRFRL